MGERSTPPSCVAASAHMLYLANAARDARKRGAHSDFRARRSTIPNEERAWQSDR